ncbi:MAG TPA: ABC transporter permease [Longimicrobium sp.]|jgi:predicted permease
MIRAYLRSLFRRGRVESELNDELSFHLEMETQANLRRGLDPAEARRRAVLDFGGVERHKEACRDEQAARPLHDLGRDLRYAGRSLRRSPGFTAAAVLTLALGIGATTAVFSLVDGVLLRPLAYPQAERLYTLFEAQPQGQMRSASYPTFQEWRRRAAPFASLAFVRGEDVLVRGSEGPQRFVGAFISGDYFRVMGTRPLLGRTPSGDREAVLSHKLWKQYFAGERSAVGRTISTREGPFTIVGVMPPGFVAPIWADMWIPVGGLPPEQAKLLADPRIHVDSEVVARLAPGMTEAGMRTRMNALAAGLVAEGAGDAGWTQVGFFSAREQAIGPGVEGRLAVLGAAVALVLLIACVNVANLLLAQATARQRELAIRTALGAGRGRLVRQLLAEGALVGLAGGVVGAAAAVAAVGFLRTRAPDALPRLAEVSVDARVLAFALAMSLGTVLVFGLLPALRGSRGDLAGALRGGRGGAGRAATRGRAALVVVEVALSLMLVVGAGLLIRGLGRLQATDAGFDPNGVVTLRVFPPAPRYADEAAARELYRRLREAAASVPGVRHAALANHIPMTGGSAVTRVQTSGPAPAEGDMVFYRSVSPEYFSAMRSRLLRGRFMQDADLAGLGGGVVITRSLAKAFFPGKDAVGQSVTLTRAAQGRPGMGDPMAARVVGVVEDERQFDLVTDPPPTVFVPYSWDPWTHIVVIARTDGDPARVVPALRRAVLAVEPEIPVAGTGPWMGFRTLRETMAGTLEGQRLNAILLAVFAVSALVLAAVGIFGVMAYVVAQRTPEIGVRLALGARPADVVRWVTWQTLRLAGAGLVLGFAGAMAATPILRSELYGVSATDPAVLLAVLAVFGAVAFLAGYLPARRAARVPPITALRAE